MRSPGLPGMLWHTELGTFMLDPSMGVYSVAFAYPFGPRATYTIGDGLSPLWIDSLGPLPLIQEESFSLPAPLGKATSFPVGVHRKASICPHRTTGVL